MEKGQHEIAPISVICCYRNSTRWNQFTSEAASLSFSEIEFVGFDNTSNRYTLPEAYNEGSQKARGEILLFVHDDVQFKTSGWDVILYESYYALPNCGVVGFAGGTNAYNGPMTWWTKVGENRIFRNMLQRLADGSDARYADSDEAVEVLGLDGFAFAIRRELIQDFQWSNDVGLWHGYDLDLCYHVHFVQGKTNYVLPVPVIHHLSLGTLNVEWGISMINIWIKYGEWLQVNSMEGIGRDALIIFINWTHNLAIKRELIGALRTNNFSVLKRVVVAMCFSNIKWRKRIGFMLLSRTIGPHEI